MITCSYCGEIFKKQNKALILKCAHSICQFCHNINLDCLICLICKVKYVGKDNLNHPINFLLVEFLEKEDLNIYINKWQSEKPNSLIENSEESSKTNAQNKDNLDSIQTINFCCDNNNRNESMPEDVKKFYCSNCSMFFRNEFHFENKNSKCKFSKKDLIMEKNISRTQNLTNNDAEKDYNNNLSISDNKNTNLSKAKILEEDSNQLMKRYNQFNSEINDLYDEYMETILLNYIDSQKLLHDKINSNRVCENLILAGIITENHFNKLLKFMLKYHKNKKLMNLIKDFSSNNNIIYIENNNKNNEDEGHVNNICSGNKGQEKFEIFLSELNSLERIYSNFKVNEFLSDYFFFKSVIEDFKKNSLNKLERLKSIFTLNTYENKEIEEDERRFKKKQAQDICEIYNRDIIQNLISEISEDMNFSQHKDIANIKYSYFFLKKKKSNKADQKQNSNNNLFAFTLNKLNLIVFDPLTESLNKFDLEILIDQIKELYDKYKVNYSQDCLKIKYLKAFDFNFDQYGNIFLFAGYFKKLTNIAKSKESTVDDIDINNKITKDNFKYIPNNLIFKINPFKKKFKVFYEFANPRFDCTSIIINKEFFFLGGKSFESYLGEKKFSRENANEKISAKFPKQQTNFGISFKNLNLKNFSLTTLKEYPLELKRKPMILNHGFENIFVCEDIRNFSFYNLKKKSWKKSQIFYNTENITNISNFVAFNFKKDVILLGGVKNIKQNSLFLKRQKIDLNNNNNEGNTVEEDDFVIKKEIKDYNDQILSIEKDWCSVSLVGNSNFHFADLYEKKFGAGKINEIERIVSDVAYLSESTYILEYHGSLGMIYIKKNTKLKAGMNFETFKLERIDEI